MKEKSAATPADLVAIGRVAGAWGVAGWLRIAPYNVSDESVLTAQRGWWQRPAAGAPVPPRFVKVERARRHSAHVLAKLQGIDDRDAAEALKGDEVLVSRALFPQTAADEYYWVDLIGCTVSNPAGETLGVVSEVDDHGAHALLRLTAVGEDGKPVQRMIPFVAAYILEVDVAAKRILADWRSDYS